MRRPLALKAGKGSRCSSTGPSILRSRPLARFTASAMVGFTWFQSMMPGPRKATASSTENRARSENSSFRIIAPG